MLADQSPFMNIPELAEWLKISNATAYSLARKNELPVPVVFVGPRRMIVSRAAVVALLADKKTAAESA